MSGSLAQWSPRVLSILRIVAAVLFLEHGANKLFGFPPSGMPAHEFHLVSLIGLSAILEFGGGLLLLAGLFTRFVAFILCGEMAVAYFMAHAPHGLYPIANHGELAALYCFVFLYLFVAGGGAWSLDRLRGKN